LSRISSERAIVDFLPPKSLTLPVPFPPSPLAIIFRSFSYPFSNLSTNSAPVSFDVGPVHNFFCPPVISSASPYSCHFNIVLSAIIRILYLNRCPTNCEEILLFRRLPLCRSLACHYLPITVSEDIRNQLVLLLILRMN